MKNYDLYLIINNTNEKRYIGITKVGYEKRFEKHFLNAARLYRRHQNIVLYSAIRKYGAENFSIEFLSEGDDWAHLKELEITAIIKYNTFIDDGYGYNMTRGGDGTDGYTFTKEQLKARSERGLSEEHKAKIKANNAKYWLGKNHTEETIEKIRAARKNQTFSEKTRKRMGESRTGGRNGMAKAVLIGKQHFETIKAAAEFIGIHPENMRKRIRNPNFPDHVWAKGSKT